jgi:hypothetical protein
LDVTIPKPFTRARVEYSIDGNFVTYSVDGEVWVTPSAAQAAIDAQRLAAFKQKVTSKSGITEPENRAVAVATTADEVKAAFSASRWRELFPND